METTPPSSPQRAPAPSGARGRNGRDDGEALLPLPSAPAAPAVPGLPERKHARRRRAWPGWERFTRFLLAFTIASLLWVYVLNLENPISTRVFNTVPVTVRDLSPDLSITVPPGDVRIEVQAPQDVLNRLNASTFNPYVDLSDHGPGSYDLPVHIITPQDAFAVRVDPYQVHLEVIAVQVTTFTVQASPQGVPALGYTVQTKQVQPESVTVRGPPDKVSRIDQVVAYINVAGQQGTVQADAAPHALDASGLEITGLQFDPDTVKVAVAIQQLLNLKTVPVHVRVEGAPAPGYGVTDIVVQPTTLTLFGAPATLNSVDLLDTKPISVRGATQTVSATVPVSLPAGVTLYPPATPNQVQVQVAIEELTTRTTLSVLVQEVGLGPGLTSIESPDRVDVTLSGPFDALQDLRPDSIKALVNLAGLGIGTYQLPLLITVPPRTTQQNVNPGTVTVTISGPPTGTPEPTPAAPLTPFSGPGSSLPLVFPTPPAPTATPPRLFGP